MAPQPSSPSLRHASSWLSRRPTRSAAGGRSVRRTAALAATTAALVVAGLTTLTAPAQAANPVTPGNFTGHGFDQCEAPSQAAMDTWRKHSPFWAAGIYISGASRGCRGQANLTPTWVRKQLNRGWRLLPITLGPQASCHPSFPRYGNDPTIKPARGKNGNYGKARKQGRKEARTAVAAAQALGIVERSTLWYDLEGFDHTNTDCRESAMAFLSGWTHQLHKLDYVSGVYSSAGSGIKALDDIRVSSRTDINLPDRIWIARWDGVANTSTSYIRSDGWLPGNRLKQYRGGHLETWGGVTINIDSNWLDLGRGSVARTETWCGGVRVNFPRYEALGPGTPREKQTIALKCRLREAGHFNGPMTGSYGPLLEASVRSWRAERGLPDTGTWSRPTWRRLNAEGKRPVLKFGSAGSDVRRLQRALNSTSFNPRLKVDGVYSDTLAATVKSWQRSVGQAQTGIVLPKSWRRLQR